MKKKLTLLILAALPLFFVACSSDQTSDEPATEDNVEATESNVSEDVVEELNEVQDINDEANALNDELDNFIDSL